MATLFSTWVDRTGNVSVTATVGQEPTLLNSGVNGFPSVDFDGTNQWMQTDINVSHAVMVYTVVKADTQDGAFWDADNPTRTTLYISGATGKIGLI